MFIDRRSPPRVSARWFAFGEVDFGFVRVDRNRQELIMQFVSAAEKVALEAKREELYKAQIDVQDRIRKAASLGDLSENAEYHFAKEENRSIQRQLAELEAKLKNLSVVSNEDVPQDVVFIGHTVKLLDLDDESEQLVQIVGEAQPPSGDGDVLPVSANSPMGEALIKARVGDTVKVRAPRGTMEFKILEIV
ncbi:MAG: GreA/GreB family elongation factor [Tepidisphaeraceae bacterium]|jgi:transcription elongation factor GreA